MTEDRYVQARLRKGNAETIGWLPSKIATRNGKKVKLKLEDGIWDYGWTITDLDRGNSVSKEQLMMLSDNYRDHRDSTDI